MNTKSSLILLASVCLAVSCNQKEISVENPMSFNVETVSMEQGSTRGTAVGNLTQFKAAVTKFGLKVHKEVKTTTPSTFSVDALAPTYAELSSSKYVMEKNYYWNPSKTLDIYAFAPFEPTGVSNYSVTAASNQASFDYAITTGTAPASMPDIMLARFKGTSTDGVATLKFRHVLAALSFKTGDMVDMTIKSISLEKIYSAGTCTATFGTSSPFAPTAVWTGNNVTTETFTYSIPDPYIIHTFGDASQEITSGTNIFMVVPQTAGANAELKIVARIGAATTDETIKCSLKDLKWDAGKIYTYQVNYEGEGILSVTDASLSVDDWDPETTTDLELDK